MSHIAISKGLDIPIEGKPTGPVQPLITSGGAKKEPSKEVALDLRPFDQLRFKLLVREGDLVKIGQPLVEDKSTSGRMFCSPAAGVIKTIHRGLKRMLLEIVIEVSLKEEYLDFPKIDVEKASKEEVIKVLMDGGMFARIRSRPFNLLADPLKTPRSIFVKAIESAPFVPPAELQVENHEKDFEYGLTVLQKLTQGSIHLIYHKETISQVFKEAKGVIKHTAEGPHPVANASLHIQMVDPIQSSDDIVWTLTVEDVIKIGHLLRKGRYLIDRVVAVAGSAILPGRAGYFLTREGVALNELFSGRIEKGPPLRFISGDPLMGEKVEPESYLGFYHQVLSIFPENTTREFLHFFRLGMDKYSFSKTYLSGHLDNKDRRYPFTTNQHGEHRAFVDATLYDKVQPLPISTMLLVKAIMAEDFELAEELGFLSVDSEDFALPAFVCPSKIEMVSIIKTGLKKCAEELVS